MNSSDNATVNYRECLLEFVFPSANGEVSFFLTGPPVFIKKPVDQIGVSGGVASFVCQATGDPKPRVTWNKKGKKVNSQRFEVRDVLEICVCTKRGRLTQSS